MVEMMRCARDLGTPADWLVRAKHDRCLPDEDGAKLWEATSTGTPLGEITFAIGSRENQKGRTVRQQLYCGRPSSRSRMGRRGGSPSNAWQSILSTLAPSHGREQLGVFA
jgi:hypothetical protein